MNVTVALILFVPTVAANVWAEIVSVVCNMKNTFKKTKSDSKPKKTTPQENIDDIPPAREKPPERKGLTTEEIEEIEYEQVKLENETIDDIFAEVEGIEDIPIISVDSKEESKKE